MNDNKQTNYIAAGIAIGTAIGGAMGYTKKNLTKKES